MKAKILTRLNVRKQANKESEVIKILEIGEIIDYTSNKNGWLKLKGKSTGYCMENFTETIDV